MFADPIAFWASTHPGRTALIDRQSGERYNYGALNRRIDRAAALLRAMGIARYDRVGVLALNRVEHIDLFYACQRLGATLVPLNWRLSPSELNGVVADAGLALCFVEERFAAVSQQLSTSVSWADVAAVESAPDMSAPPAIDNQADDPALVLYTSGSAGKPKGAVLPHRQILYNAIATTTAWQLTGDDVAVITTPFFHTGGWNVFATPLWQRGGAVVLSEKFDPEDFLHTMKEEGCTVALTVPTQLLMLLEASSWGVELPRLRSLFSGGAPCPPSVLNDVRAAGYTIREGYGLTECGPNCFTISAQEAIANPGAVGRPVPFLEMRVVDDELNDVAAGRPGELLLRGPQVFAGYHNDPVRTQEVLLDGGWLRTGDLAIRSDEGVYRIAGRKKEMYISGGENVYPGEVEAVLSACPGVAEVAVVGVTDSRWGEVGRAFVVSRHGMSVNEADVMDFANSRLARYKLPRSVSFVEALPRLGSGKVDKQTLLTWP